jgi:hypothetical protein
MSRNTPQFFVAGESRNATEAAKAHSSGFRDRGLQSSLKGAPMDSKLMRLRQQETETFAEFLKARGAYLKAAAPSARKSDAELKEAVEEYLKAAERYETALQELREYLLGAEPSGTIAAELGYAERLLKAIHKEMRGSSKLLNIYIKLSGRHAEEE